MNRTRLHDRVIAVIGGQELSPVEVVDRLLRPWRKLAAAADRKGMARPPRPDIDTRQVAHAILDLVSTGELVGRHDDYGGAIAPVFRKPRFAQEVCRG